MVEAVERLVNLAFFLADARQPVSAERIRAEVTGYPSDQDEAAFLRMFERDKDALRGAGFAILSTADGLYRLDAAATFASEVELTASETAMLRAVGAALLEDPGFPFAADLRLALAKLAMAAEDGCEVFSALGAPSGQVVARIADEAPADQAALVARIDEAIVSRKRVEFDYTNARGEDKHHEIEPYGMFVREGRWYLVGRDALVDQVRVYALTRARKLRTNAARPKNPDFEPPADFDVATFIGLPFQYGPGVPFEATVRFDAPHAWRAEAVTAGEGELQAEPDGAVTWTVSVRDERRLLRWLVENGPGLTPVAPPHLAGDLADGIDRVVARHG